MTMTLDLSEEVVTLLHAEAERRQISVDALIEEMAMSLTLDVTSPARTRLTLVAIGSSTSGLYSSEADELLADGFGTD